MAKAAAALDLFKDLPLKASGDPEEVNLPIENPPIGDAPEITPAPPIDNPEEDDDEDNDEEETPAASAAGLHMTELDMLKQRATLMGIKFSNNIGLNFLKAKVQAKIDGKPEVELPESAEPQKAQLPLKTDRQQMYEQEMRLIRLRITNLDPKKKDLPGEIFTVANELLGAVKKYIPYGEATDNGYHVPYIIYRQLKEREFLNIKTRKDRQGRTIVESNMAREFALEELTPLTQRELDRLAASQAAASGMSN